MMVLKSFLLASAIISHAMAIIPSLINSPAQEEHTRFYLKRYWKWQNQNVYNWNHYLTPFESEVVEQIISMQGQWLVSLPVFKKESLFNWNLYLTPFESKVVEQIISMQGQWLVSLPVFKKESLLIGYHSQKMTSHLTYSLSLYIPEKQAIKDLASLYKIRDFAYKIRDFAFVQFVLWRTIDNAICFGRSGGDQEQIYRCYNRQTQVELGSFSEKNIPSGSTGDKLFHDSVIHEREIVNKEKKEFFYYIASSQFTLLPDVLKPIVVHHGTEARLPFDKISISEGGDVAIFYP